MILQRFMLIFTIGLLVLSPLYAQNDVPALMTAQDIENNDLSNISIINGTNRPTTIYGLYILSFDANDCSSCSGNIYGGNNAQGAIVSPTFSKPNQAIPIGKNYLYNMLYNGLYAVSANATAPCKLPGCSWPDDIPLQGWCLTIGAMSLDSTYTYSDFKNGSTVSNVVPYAAAVTSAPMQYNYNYDLIDPATLGTGAACLGPIVCDDKSLTCTATTSQNETFRPY